VERVFENYAGRPFPRWYVQVDCPCVARGETEEVHGYTDEQLNDPEMMNKVKVAIKEQ
jgi:hypothetical protein